MNLIHLFNKNFRIGNFRCQNLGRVEKTGKQHFFGLIWHSRPAKLPEIPVFTVFTVFTLSLLIYANVKRQNVLNCWQLHFTLAVIFSLQQTTWLFLCGHKKFNAVVIFFTRHVHSDLKLKDQKFVSPILNYNFSCSDALIQLYTRFKALEA